MAWMWTLHTLTPREAHLVNLHPTHLTSNLLCSCLWTHLQWQATGVPAELESNEVHPVSWQHTPSSPLSETQTATVAASRKFHKHLISQEYYLKTKSLRIRLNCRDQCFLQMCLHLPEYTGIQSPLKSVGHRC